MKVKKIKKVFDKKITIKKIIGMKVKKIKKKIYNN